MKPIKPYGPRGLVMCIFGLVLLLRGGSLFFNKTEGLPLVLTYIDPTAAAIICGLLWAITGLVVFIWSFRKHQERALATWAGFNFLWGFLYLLSFVIPLLMTMTITGAWFPALFYFSMSAVILALARMINPVDTIRENHEPQ